jgi:hypothetical protein
MTSRLAVAVLIAGSACVALPAALAQPDVEVVKESTIELPLGTKNWDMRQLDREPVRMVSYTAVKRQVKVPSPLPPSERSDKPEKPEKPEKPGKPEELNKPAATIEQTVVAFVLEFERDLTIRDTDWTGVRPEPPYRFDFLDKDGVTLASELARYEGIPVGRKGRRVRVVLTLPAERLMSRVARVVVEPKRYGDLPQ